MNWETVLENAGRWSIVMAALALVGVFGWHGKSIPTELDAILAAGGVYFFKEPLTAMFRRGDGK